MMRIHEQLQPADLLRPIRRLWELSAAKIDSIEKSCPPGAASPVFTWNGRYAARGWTEWTQGFAYGSAILQFDATGDQAFLQLGRDRTIHVMAPHLTHLGVHDHGFNNLSTYGNLWRLMNEGVIPENPWERSFYELALKVTGAVQAARWSQTCDGGGYIYSFNGPQSLFVDTLRSCRALAVSHQLGHLLMGERDRKIVLLDRLIQHALATARYNIYYGRGRDAYDTPAARGRTAQESLFNVNNGDYRAPSTQQGYSPFSTWTRGLSWAMLGFAEQLEYLICLDDAELVPYGGRAGVEAVFLEAAAATCDFYIAHSPTDGIPYWDTGAPNLHHLGDYLDRPADPFNDHEPVDSSAAAIGSQGLLRLGRYLESKGRPAEARRYTQAGLTILKTLFDEPYLSTDANHQGLILHSIYHRPNGWDHAPTDRSSPRGESSMWGDYHAREAALYVQRLAHRQTYPTFFKPPR